MDFGWLSLVVIVYMWFVQPTCVLLCVWYLRKIHKQQMQSEYSGWGNWDE